MKFQILLPAIALLTSSLAAPVANAEPGLDLFASLGLGGLTGGQASASAQAGFTSPSAIQFGAGFSMDTCQLSMKAWLQAKGLCESDGSIGGKAQAYINGVLGGKTGFEGLFGMAAGFNLGGSGGLSVAAGLSLNAVFLKSSCQGLIAKPAVTAGASITVDQCGSSMKGWLQAKGLCEGDGSIGQKAKDYLNGCKSGKSSFEGLLGITAGVKLGANGSAAGDLKGVAVGTITGAIDGLLNAGANVGGQVSSELTGLLTTTLCGSNNNGGGY